MGSSRHGFEVEMFVDSRSALQNFKAGMYDVILLDVLMKGLDGFELYSKIRKIDENIQICFISASNSSYEIQEHISRNSERTFYTKTS